MTVKHSFHKLRPASRFLALLSLAGLLAGAALPLHAQEPAKHIVLFIGEDEYLTWETLPEFAGTDLTPAGYRVTTIHADEQNPNRFPGLIEALHDADLVILSVRRRTPPKEQLDAFRAYLEKGRPLIAIRTSSHAFALRNAEDTRRAREAGLADWPEFDPEVLGGNYTGHHGRGPMTRLTAAPGQRGHPLLDEVDLERFQGNGSLYKARPLAESAVPVLIGSIPDQPEEPVVWIRRHGPEQSRIFYTSLGHPDDFANPEFRRLLLNAVRWCVDQPEAEASSGSRGTDPASSANEGAGDSTGFADDDALRPSANVPSLRVRSDLELDQVLRDPEVANPLHLSFDERGRLWVVQYRQYPWPAGLRLVSRDNVWRNVYDPPFPPPPPHPEGSAFRGQDRITIHEDTDGDGTFDRTKVFLDGLNLATAALKGRGGVFVMNPPCLLFYADRDNDDVPDSESPEILLTGFGIEDSHSIANSLRWGPDGWIYGTQGSTVSATIVRHGPDGQPVPDEPPVHTMGQNVWRYHPESRRYEVFAEGGGNAFGVEIDRKGRIFSGHNGGDTRGFHYVQGGYSRKGFDKHGDLSNPYTFGYFPAMKHPRVERFTHTFSIYEARALPARYHGLLIGLAPHLHYVIGSDLFRDGSSFQTRDTGKLIVPGDGERDDWFTPVDIQIGPDGALYIADWYSRQTGHYYSHEGQTDPTLGRVHRLRARDGESNPPIDLGALSGDQLVDRLLDHPNRWHRQQALRLLGDRKDATLIPRLRSELERRRGQPALEALWALHLSGGFDEPTALKLLEHPESHVRRWTVRLLGDTRSVSSEIAERLIHRAVHESDVETRSQIASTARRLPASTALLMLAGLLEHPEDAADPHLPLLLWWGLESKAGSHDALLKFFSSPIAWTTPIRPAGNTLAENLMRRWAMTGSRADLLSCATLLSLAPDSTHRHALARAFTSTLEGRPLPVMPEQLATALASIDEPFALILEVRGGSAGSAGRALEFVSDPDARLAFRAQLIRALGDVRALPKETVPVFLNLVSSSEPLSLKQTALAALQSFDDPEIGRRIAGLYPGLSADLQLAAESLLASRASWAQSLSAALDDGTIQPASLQSDTIAKMRRHQDKTVRAAVERHFGRDASPTSVSDDRLQRMALVARRGGGDPLKGRELYRGKTGCAACHVLFGEGGRIGPDLTPYDRRNLDAMLLAIVNPAAEIREGYENITITTRDGRLLSGFKVEADDHRFVLRGLDGQNLTVAREDILSLEASEHSLMPEGLLDPLTDAELRDFFAFLSSTTPPM